MCRLRDAKRGYKGRTITDEGVVALSVRGGRGGLRWRSVNRGGGGN